MRCRTKDPAWFLLGVIVSLVTTGYVLAGPPNCPEAGLVVGQTKISETSGGLGAVLDQFDFFARSAASLGDIDGDGVEDLAVGALFDDDGGTDRGAVYILFLNSNGTVRAQQKISSTTGGFAGPLDNGDNFGVSVARLSDLDGDGVEDLAVGAHFDDDGGQDRGAVYILFLNPNGTVRAQQKISSTTGGFAGALDDFDFFGISVASLGDIDGDGIEDLAVGAQLDDDGGLNRGAVYILFMNTNGTVRARQKISSTSGGFAGPLVNNDVFGFSAAAMGDLDDDGITELTVGAPFDDDGGTARGALYVLFMNTNGTVRTHQKISSTRGGFAGPLADSDQFGTSTASLGDLDGDGVEDLAVGAHFDDTGGTDRGAVYILFMNTNGTVRAQQKISSTTGGFAGPLDNVDRFGISVAALGDLDGDGARNIAIGAYQDDDGGTDQGAVWILDHDNCVMPPSFVQNTSPCALLLPPSGGLAGFTIIVTGDGTLSYQWRRDGVPLVNGGPISGANSPNLTLNATAASEGLYDCVVTNQFGSVTSSRAVLGIRPPAPCPGDANGNRMVTFDDIITVLANFGNSCP